MSPARSARPDLAPQTRLILITVAIIGFACSMPFRCLDPVVPQIAEQFRIDDHEAGVDLGLKPRLAH